MKTRTLEEYLPLLSTSPITFKLYVKTIGKKLVVELQPPGGEPWVFEVHGDTLTYIPDFKE